MNALPDHLSPRYRAFLKLMRSLDAIWNASRLFLAPWNLSPSQFNLLNLLAGFPNGCSQTELGRQLITHRSNITGLVDRLAFHGLVQRRDDPRDRRAFVVVLTPAGLKFLNGILPAYYEAAEAVWGNLPVQNIQSIVQNLAGVEDNALRIARAKNQSRGRSRRSRSRPNDSNHASVINPSD